MLARAALFAALALPTLAVAQAGSISAENPDSIRAGIVAYGHKARLETDEGGNPVIEARMGSINYSVYFYGCEAGQNCLDIQFSSSFDVETPLTPEWANQWNLDWALGRVAVDENGDPFLTFAVSAVGGMSPEYFNGVVEAWESVLNSFMDDIDW